MARLVTFIDNGMLSKIQEMASTAEKPLSQVAAELLEIGYRVKTSNNIKEEEPEEIRMKELIEKHTEYQLRILATTSDILRYMYTKESKYNGDDVEKILEQIKTSMRDYIEGYLHKDQ